MLSVDELRNLPDGAVSHSSLCLSVSVVSMTLPPPLTFRTKTAHLVLPAGMCHFPLRRAHNPVPPVRVKTLPGIVHGLPVVHSGPANASLGRPSRCIFARVLRLSFPVGRAAGESRRGDSLREQISATILQPIGPWANRPAMAMTTDRTGLCYSAARSPRASRY